MPDDKFTRFQMACSAAGGLACDLRHAAHVVADRRQDAACTRADGKPLVASGALPHRTWIDDVSHAVWQPQRRSAIRLHIASAPDTNKRRFSACFSPDLNERGGFFRP